MASSLSLSLLPLLLLLLILLSSHSQAQPAAPAPAPEGPVNLTGILDKNGQFNTFIRLLTSTQVGDQVNTQVNSSADGMTVFAPTDNAFNNLKAGTINSLTPEDQVRLVLYHVLYKFYSLENFETASNPVRTQASGGEGGVWGLNFTAQNNQVNVSTGVVETQINNVLRKDRPLAVYQVDKVLLPMELFGPKPPAGAPVSSPPPPPKTAKGGSNATVEAAEAPKDDSGSGRMNVGLAWVLGFALVCMGALS